MAKVLANVHAKQAKLQSSHQKALLQSPVDTQFGNIPFPNFQHVIAILEKLSPSVRQSSSGKCFAQSFSLPSNARPDGDASESDKLVRSQISLRATILFACIDLLCACMSQYLQCEQSYWVMASANIARVSINSDWSAPPHRSNTASAQAGSAMPSSIGELWQTKCGWGGEVAVHVKISSGIQK